MLSPGDDMSKDESRLRRLAARLDIQPEAAFHAPRITVSGSSSVLVEGHRGLLEYAPGYVAAAGAGCRILIRGENLRLEAMDGGELVVSGRLWAVELE